jgi:hypothetical protein
LIGLFQGDGSTAQKFQYGIATTAKLRIFQNLVNIIGHGKKSRHLKDVTSAAILNLLAKIEHLILGWILALLHYLLQKIKEIKNYTNTATQQK